VPFKNRGFTRTNTRQKAAPRLGPRPDRSIANRVAGAPIIPRAQSGPSTKTDPYRTPPHSVTGPVTEWAVMYDLTVARKFVEGVDFLYQPALTAPGLNKKGFNRADFLILPQGKGAAAASLAPRGIIINPISDFTHPSRALDILERTILLGQGFLEIFVADYDLQVRAHVVIGLALAGIDVSSRGTGQFRQ
jgi:hypothetical protein